MILTKRFNWYIVLVFTDVATYTCIFILQLALSIFKRVSNIVYMMPLLFFILIHIHRCQVWLSMKQSVYLRIFFIVSVIERFQVSTLSLIRWVFWSLYCGLLHVICLLCILFFYRQSLFNGIFPLNMQSKVFISLIISSAKVFSLQLFMMGSCCSCNCNLLL